MAPLTDSRIIYENIARSATEAPCFRPGNTENSGRECPLLYVSALLALAIFSLRVRRGRKKRSEWKNREWVHFPCGSERGRERERETLARVYSRSFIQHATISRPSLIFTKKTPLHGNLVVSFLSLDRIFKSTRPMRSRIYESLMNFSSRRTCVCKQIIVKVQ